MENLSYGAYGADVKEFQEKLLEAGFNPGEIDGEFGPATEQALINYQKAHALLPDGVAGHVTLTSLGFANPPGKPSISASVTVEKVCQMFPPCAKKAIDEYLRIVLGALVQHNLDDKPMVLMALSTIRAETEGFRPISEYKSKYNTSPNGHPFDLYDNRKELGNTGKPDGESFKGRGFIQLTGRDNYTRYSHRLFHDDRLVTNPDLANEPNVAADLLALFLKDKETKIKKALLENDLKSARRLVNGGSHGMDRFEAAYRIGEKVL